MRVIAGELRGRRLASPPPEADVRPTPDRVREALFSIIAGGVPGALVLDLYCGTGALAIEALSRGAAMATLVDTDVTLAERNVAALGLEERTEVVRADALDFLAEAEEEWDLILCDPPYRLAARLQAPLEKLVPDRLAADGRLVVESAGRASLALSLPVVRERVYGNTRISIYGGSDG